MDHKAFRPTKKMAKIQDILQLGGQAPAGYKLPDESAAAKQLRDHMRGKGWLTIKIHGSIFLRGFPDLVCIHPEHGIRFIETKSLRAGHKLEPSQSALFLQMHEHGAKIYVIRGPHEYGLLFKSPNWSEFI